MGAVLTAVLTGCSMIDEDLSNCEEQEQEQARLDYELRLVTNLTTELETELSAQTDVDISNALRQFLSSIFTDHAHDVDLSFYDTQGDSLRLQHDQHIMDASQASYTLNLPKREYMHLAVANVLDNQLVDLFDDNRCHTSNLSLTGKDTIPSHTTGLFTARQPMNVLEGVSQQFNVRLYMANCAAALIVDTQGARCQSPASLQHGLCLGLQHLRQCVPSCLEESHCAHHKTGSRKRQQDRLLFCDVSLAAVCHFAYRH